MRFHLAEAAATERHMRRVISCLFDPRWRKGDLLWWVIGGRRSWSLPEPAGSEKSPLRLSEYPRLTESNASPINPRLNVQVAGEPFSCLRFKSGRQCKGADDHGRFSGSTFVGQRRDRPARLSRKVWPFRRHNASDCHDAAIDQPDIAGDREVRWRKRQRTGRKPGTWWHATWSWWHASRARRWLGRFAQGSLLVQVRRSPSAEIAGTSIGDAVPANPAIVTGASFAVVDGRKLLFSEVRQEIYQLNDAAAYIWCRLEQGDQPSTIAAGLVDLGAPPETADDHVGRMLSDWRQLGLFIPASGDTAAVDASTIDIRRQLIHLAGLSIEIRHGSDALARLAAPAFIHLQDLRSGTSGYRPADLSLSTRAEGDLVRIQAGRTEIGLYDLHGIVPALKAQLTADILAHADYSIAIHAASLTRHRRMLLLCGEPGVGKTTLALMLTHNGFGYAGDDIAFLSHSGRVRGVPFAASVKSGAWRLLSDIRRDLETLQIFRRCDNQDVRYVPPVTRPVIEALPLGWMVLLRRQPRGAAVLTRMDRLAAMRTILAEATTPDRRLSAAAFGLLTEALAEAECFILTYADLDDAVRALQRACQ